MRLRNFFIVAITALVTYISLQAFVGHRYNGQYGWHRWNYWNAPDEYYGPGRHHHNNYYRHRNRWNDEPQQDNPADSAEIH